jgi:hypothetical protein
MIIPMWVDEKKDKRLIDWLNSKTNRSAFMRLVLYDKMEGNRVSNVGVYDDKVEDDFMRCIENL